MLHQGSCKGKRTHLFARCVESSTNDVIENNLKPEALLDNIEHVSANYNWDFNQNYYLFNLRAKSLFNLILYYFPIFKYWKNSDFGDKTNWVFSFAKEDLYAINER